ncbi:membrane fusion protein (MFP) component of efflux pump [Klebsiella michiganensis]|uniref:Membrane fusion protein (MFP) component of efflux pump n=1 Tax=Klebsiella michiganensis TaxID=1134687 RepID=A0A7H4LWU3_9ENTR|nr:membrane fusion protein (MFP) component of efflux pump [Klebsiella michiganensis]
MKKPLIVVVLLLLLAAVIGGGWWWYQSSQQKALTLYGNVDIRTVNLSFRVGGRLASLSVDEGDAIKAGQTLGELDRAPYENALQQAQANVSTAQAQYDLMMAGIARKRSLRPPPRSTRRRPLTTMRRIFTSASWGCAKQRHLR